MSLPLPENTGVVVPEEDADVRDPKEAPRVKSPGSPLAPPLTTDLLNKLAEYALTARSAPTLYPALYELVFPKAAQK